MPDTIEDLTLLQQLQVTRKERIDALAALVENRQTQREAFEKRESSESEKPASPDSRWGGGR